MVNYQKARVKLTNTQLTKSKSPAKYKAGAILTINKKRLQDEEFPYELFLTIRQTTTTINVLANNFSIDIKLSKAQTSKMIQPGAFLCDMLRNLGKKK